jgi:Amt family ammonium transporter
VRVRQILINLVGNAIKFTQYGEIQLVTRMDAPTPGAPPMLRFDVRDTGIGVSPEQALAIFQPFTQADTSITREFGGTGLGLAISKRIADRLGGDIAVTSAPEEGSTFSLTIDPGPLDDVKMVEDPHQIAPPEKRETPAKKEVVFPPDALILLVEDGIDNQTLLSFFLKKAGARVMVVDNGEIAVEKVDLTLKGYTRRRGDPPGPFDLILMDMQMPVMDGYEATWRIRELGYKGPIIALTAHAMTEDRQKCLDAGCDDYITKPVKRDTFLSVVAEHLEQKTGADRT